MTQGSSLLFIDLPRPEYVASPEILISSLAWREFAYVDPSASSPQALAYRTDDRTSTKIEFRSTEPTDMSGWGESLSTAGLKGVEDFAILGAATAVSIAGIRAKKAKGQAATPLTPALALLQDARGMLGKKNPPNIGLILEELYRLGASSFESTSATAASHWRHAAERRLSSDPLLQCIDTAAREFIFGGLIESRRDGSIETPQTRPLLAGDTPFTWFHVAWSRITSDDWVDALPSRRWVDWASTVLRAAIAFGYLWQSRYNEEVARAVIGGSLNNEIESPEAIVERINPVAPWVNRSEQVSVRDVGSRLKASVRRGSNVNLVFKEWRRHNNELEGSSSAQELLEIMSTDGHLVDALLGALGSKRDAGKLTWEAIRYSLQVRDRSGPFADHYGLFASRGTRYLLVDPGVEWIAVMASLVASGPGSRTTLGDVQRSLRSLGLEVELPQLVDALESAGLARGSADADQAVIVETAY